MHIEIDQHNRVTGLCLSPPSHPPEGVTYEAVEDDDPRVLEFQGREPGAPLPPATPEEAAERANATINEQWHEREFDTFTYGDRPFQCDPQSQIRIMGQVNAILMGDTAEITWKSADNEMVTLTASEFQQLAIAAKAHCASLFAHAQAHKAEVEAIANDPTLPGEMAIAAIQDYVDEMAWT